MGHFRSKLWLRAGPRIDTKNRLGMRLEWMGMIGEDSRVDGSHWEETEFG